MLKFSKSQKNTQRQQAENEKTNTLSDKM